MSTTKHVTLEGFRNDERNLGEREYRTEVAAAVARFVSAKMGQSFDPVSWEDGYVLLRRKGRKSLYVAVGTIWHGAFVVRGLLRVTSRHGRWAYLCNGQAARGTQQVAHWGEGQEARCHLAYWGSDRLRSYLEWEDEFAIAMGNNPPKRWRVEDTWTPEVSASRSAE